MAGRVVRISVTLPEDLYRDFEKTARKMGYSNRSKAVGDSLRKFVVDFKILDQMDTKGCAGTVTYVYRHHARGISEMLTELQHEHSDVINSSLHIHLDEEACLESLAVRGSISRVKDLIQKLRTLRTENVQYILMPHP